MSTDCTVTIHVAAEAVTRLVRNNSPALAARLALADFEAEFGRLPPGSLIEVAWQADSDGQSGRRRYGRCLYTDLDAVRAALPGAESALSPPAQSDDSDEPFSDWWAARAESPPPEPYLTAPVYVAEAAWDAALAWAAGQAEAAGPAIMRPIREALAGEWRNDQGYTRWGAVEAEAMNAVAALAAAIRAGRP